VEQGRDVALSMLARRDSSPSSGLASLDGSALDHTVEEVVAFGTAKSRKVYRDRFVVGLCVLYVSLPCVAISILRYIFCLTFFMCFGCVSVQTKSVPVLRSLPRAKFSLRQEDSRGSSSAAEEEKEPREEDAHEQEGAELEPDEPLAEEESILEDEPMQEEAVHFSSAPQQEEGEEELTQAPPLVKQPTRHSTRVSMPSRALLEGMALDWRTL
jgi:hypothetical protein